MTPFVLKLGDERAHDPALVGPKAAHLSALAATHPVPDGFCLTAAAYRHAHAAGGMSDEVREAVRQAYAELVGNDPNPAPVAVRSSALDEDGPTASFAGQHDTILDVIGFDAVLAAIETTWRSLHAPSALAYRRSQGLPVEGLALAVLVQNLVRADRSGVAFSVDPVTGRSDRIVVNAAWGLGESMVNGTVTPDTWHVDKRSLAVIEERLAEKERMTVAAMGGTREVAVPEFLKSTATLDEAMRTDVAELARTLEAELGWPVDIEFAFEGDRLLLLQCRPVTTARTSTSGDDAVELPEPWLEPSDAKEFWELDRVHFPDPIPVLDFAYAHQIMNDAINHALQLFELPFKANARRFWSYLYFQEAPYDRGEQDADEQAAKTKARIDALQATWDETWHPTIRQALDDWSAFDLEGASDEALLAHLDATWERTQAVWRMHFEIVFSLGRAIRDFVALYDELFEPDDAMAAHDLLKGTDTLTLVASRAVWALRDVVDATPGAAEIVSTTTPSELTARLASDASLAPVADAVRDYLANYGARTPILNLSAPTLREDPTPVLKILKEAVASPNADPARDHAEILLRRDAATEEARAALTVYPEPVRIEFERRLSTARTATRLREDHNYLIDFSWTAAVRAVYVEVGRRLAAAGSIDAPGDVIHVTPEESRAAFVQRPMGDLHTLVEERKAEMERYASTPVPETLGPRPNTRKPKPSLDALKRRVARDGLITGEAGSPGIARGRARVIRSLADAELLQAGEVLVAPTTSQPWMPLFGAAAALVTETGGVLSHAAVVAREFKLPAVVAVAGATQLVQDGQLLEVDGDRGLVRIVEDL